MTSFQIPIQSQTVFSHTTLYHTKKPLLLKAMLT